MTDGDPTHVPAALPTGGDTRSELRKRGRPAKLTDELTQTVYKLVAGGNYIEVAAASVGVSRETLFRWLREGARLRAKLDAFATDEEADAYLNTLTDHEVAQADFSHSMEKAQAEAETVDVLYIRKAAKDHWQAAMTRLERRHPKRWGRREQVEVSGQLDGVRVEADNPQAAVDASKALQDARASELACDLLEHLAGDTEQPTEGEDDDGQPDTNTTADE